MAGARRVGAESPEQFAACRITEQQEALVPQPCVGSGVGAQAIDQPERLPSLQKTRSATVKRRVASDRGSAWHGWGRGRGGPPVRQVGGVIIARSRLRPQRRPGVERRRRCASTGGQVSFILPATAAASCSTALRTGIRQDQPLHLSSTAMPWIVHVLRIRRPMGLV